MSRPGAAAHLLRTTGAYFAAIAGLGVVSSLMDSLGGIHLRMFQASGPVGAGMGVVVLFVFGGLLLGGWLLALAASYLRWRAAETPGASTHWLSAFLGVQVFQLLLLEKFELGVILPVAAMSVVTFTAGLIKPDRGLLKLCAGVATFYLWVPLARSGLQRREQVRAWDEAVLTDAIMAGDAAAIEKVLAEQGTGSPCLKLLAAVADGKGPLPHETVRDDCVSGAVFLAVRSGHESAIRELIDDRNRSFLLFHILQTLREPGQKPLVEKFLAGEGYLAPGLAGQSKVDGKYLFGSAGDSVGYLQTMRILETGDPKLRTRTDDVLTWFSTDDVFYAASEAGDLERAKAALTQGANVNRAGHCGATPLVASLVAGALIAGDHLEEIRLERFLLEHKADPNLAASSPYCFTGQVTVPRAPLWHALDSTSGARRIALVRALLEAGADPHAREPEKGDFLNAARSSGDAALVETLRSRP